MRLKHKRLRKKLIAAGVLAALVITLLLLKQSVWVSENLFTKGFSRAYINFVGLVTGIFPFSVFELLIAVAVVIAIISIIKIIKNIKKRKPLPVANTLTTIVIVALSVTLLYTATASFSYNRAPIDGHIPSYKGEQLDAERIEKLANYHINEFNHLASTFERDKNGDIIPPYTQRELARRMQAEFERLDDEYYNSYTPLPKPIISSYIMSQFAIIGVSFQPTAEPNYNRNTPNVFLPALMAHEIAHSKGIMRESEAELISAFITLSSSDNYIRYSGYCNFYYRILSIYDSHGMSDEYSDALEKIDPAIMKELDRAYASYDKYSALNSIGSFFNDLYLKMSGIKEGSGSYTDSGNVDIVVDPDTGEEIDRIVTYSPIQSMLISLYFEKAS